MRPTEVSTEVASAPGDVWDFVWADGGPPRLLADMHNLGYWSDVTAVEEFQVRPDGTPRYRTARKLGPLPAVRMTSAYDVFERPFRAVNHVEDSPLRGDFVATYQPFRAGTRVTWCWHLSAGNPLLQALLAVARPMLVRSMQKDLDALAEAAVQKRR